MGLCLPPLADLKVLEQGFMRRMICSSFANVAEIMQCEAPVSMMAVTTEPAILMFAFNTLTPEVPFLSAGGVGS